MQMKRIVGTCLVLLALLVAVPNSASAQRRSRNLSIFGGVYIPTEDYVDETVGSPWWQVGGSYDFAASGDAVHRLSASYVWAPGKTFFDRVGDQVKQDFYMIPVTYTYVIEPRGRRRGLYYGIGGGAYFAHGEVKYPLFTDTLDQTKWGVHAILGLPITTGLSIEGRYTQIFGHFGSSPNVQGLGLNGVTVAAVGRF